MFYGPSSEDISDHTISGENFRRHLEVGRLGNGSWKLVWIPASCIKDSNLIPENSEFTISLEDALNSKENKALVWKSEEIFFLQWCKSVG